MSKKILHTDAAPAAVGKYSQAVSANGFVFTAGQIGLDPATGDLIEGIEAQTERVLDNLAAVLAAADLGFGDVVKTTILLADMGDFKQVNEIYAKRFDADPPARVAYQAAALPLGSLVEI